MAKSTKFAKLKYDCHSWYVSFALHTSIIEKHWINATLVQGLRHNKWVVIPSFVLKGLTQNVKMDHKKKFQKKPPDYVAFVHVQIQVHLKSTH